MKKKYVPIKGILRDIILFTIITIIFMNIANISKLFAASIGILVSVIKLIMIFNDYKLTLSDKEIVLYKLFRKKITILSQDILEIEIGKYDTINRAQGTIRYMYIKTQNYKYKFNVHELENEKFYDDIMQFTTKRNIKYLNSK